SSRGTGEVADSPAMDAAERGFAVHDALLRRNRREAHPYVDARGSVGREGGLDRRAKLVQLGDIDAVGAERAGHAAVGAVLQPVVGDPVGSVEELLGVQGGTPGPVV